jgi:hypothetical protein
MASDNANRRSEHDAARLIADLGFNDRLDPFLSDRLDERPVIALVLVGILDRELANRVIKGSTRTRWPWFSCTLFPT